MTKLSKAIVLSLMYPKWATTGNSNGMTKDEAAKICGCGTGTITMARRAIKQARFELSLEGIHARTIY